MMFKAPADLEIPEGTKEGDTFEAMATFMMKPDGMLSVEAVEGSPIGGAMEDEEGPEDEMEDEMEEEGAPMKKGGMAPSFLIAIEKGMGPKKK
jgi:hypothetical protein